MLKYLSLFLLALLTIRCGDNGNDKKLTRPMTMDEHYRRAAGLMCKCLEESLRDTSYMLSGAIMNKCETKTVQTYLLQVYHNLKIDTADEEKVSDFSINMVKAVDTNECKAIGIYKSLFLNDATKSEK